MADDQIGLRLHVRPPMAGEDLSACPFQPFFGRTLWCQGHGCLLGNSVESHRRRYADSIRVATGPYCVTLVGRIGVILPTIGPEKPGRSSVHRGSVTGRG